MVRLFLFCLEGAMVVFGKSDTERGTSEGLGKDSSEEDLKSIPLEPTLAKK